MRRKSKPVKVGKVTVGGAADISVQSMTNTKTSDVEGTVNQIKQLEKVGCEIIRVAVPDKESLKALSAIRSKISIPLVADVHFNYRLALEALDQHVDKIRINPGNIGSLDGVKEIVRKAKDKNVSIRIGVNAGSLHPKFEDRKDLAEALVDSALEYVHLFEGLSFNDIVISVKSSSVPVSIKAYSKLAKQVEYPLHLGITEAGTFVSGTVKSAVGIGTLLAQGIGDTVRVSLAADPIKEVKIGYEILKSLGLRKRGPELICCPTCGRCEIDLIKLAQKVEEKLLNLKKPVKVAVMGCIVNGPGEAKEADVGIAGGKGVGLLFKKGKSIKKVPEDELIDVLLEEIKNL